MTTVWQRWTRLRNVAQEQEKILEDAVQEWKGFNDKVDFSLGKSSPCTSALTHYAALSCSREN